MRRFQKLLAISIIVILTCLEQWTTLDEWLDHKYISLSIPIFGFHNITVEQSQSYLDYNYDDLHQLLGYLVSHNYYFLDTSEFYEYFISEEKDLASLSGKKPIMLTFDDGDTASTQNVLSLIREFNERDHSDIKVVLFLNTIGFENNDKTVKCSDLHRPLLQGEVDIQSHGHSHTDLLRLNKIDLVDELQRSNSMLLSCKLESELRYSNPDSILSLAYPFNSWDKRVQNIVEQKYDAAYTYVNSVFRWGWHDNPYEIPRIRVYSRNNPEMLIAIAQQSREISSNPQKKYYKPPNQGRRLFMRWL